MPGQLRRRLRKEEEGQALALVVFLIVVLTILSAVLIDSVRGSQASSNDSNVVARSHSAADAGLNEYIARILDDNLYYLQYLAPGEATRQSSGNPAVSSVQPPAAPTSWSYGTQWTQPTKDAWVDLGNGYSYDLQIVAPKTGNNPTNYVQVTSTGRPTSGGNQGQWQVIQMLIRPQSIADFQMFSAAGVSYGCDAVTNGKIYTQGNLSFSGKAYADLLSEQSVSYPSPPSSGPGQQCPNGSGSLAKNVVSPAQVYTSSTIRTAPGLKTKPDFANFQTSLINIKRAAQDGKGIYLGNPSAAAWQLTFNTNGTVTYASCVTQGRNPAPIQITKPLCDGSVANRGVIAGVNSTAGSGTVTVPVNGAIYVDQSVIIANGSSSCLSGGQAGGPTGSHVQLTNASCVKGRVTVASGANVVIGDDMGYVTPGVDVLGLIAQTDIYIASWLPAGSTLNWSAAVLAENGSWGQPCKDGSDANCSGSDRIADDSFGTMYHEGAIAQKLFGNGMTMFSTRYYNYDPNLQTVQPPFYPTLPDPYEILLYRNMPASG